MPQRRAYSCHQHRIFLAEIWRVPCARRRRSYPTHGLADGIGRDSGKIQIKDGTGKSVAVGVRAIRSAAEALARAKEWLAELSPVPPKGVGHRVVHGGPKLIQHQLITPEVLQELRACVHFAPLHIPPALTLIEAAKKMYPGVRQFACFDTLFHAQMPEVASRYALPRPLFDEGLKRYGFHGLSYESILRHLGTELPRHVVIAHLGNGAICGGTGRAFGRYLDGAHADGGNSDGNTQRRHGPRRRAVSVAAETSDPGFARIAFESRRGFEGAFGNESGHARSASCRGARRCERPTGH